MSADLDIDNLPRDTVTVDAGGAIRNPRSAPPVATHGPTFLRPIKEELTLRATTTLGAALAWPIRLVATFIEFIVGAVSSMIRMLLMVLVVPAVGMLMYNFIQAKQGSGPAAIGRAAGIAVTQTVGGITTGVWEVMTGSVSDTDTIDPSPTPSAEAKSSEPRRRHSR